MAVTMKTPWGVTGVWMTPKAQHPVYDAVNPWGDKKAWCASTDPGVFNPPEGALSTVVMCTTPPDLMPRVIGKQGAVFNAITKAIRGARYIWYLHASHTIVLYADNVDDLAQMVLRVEDRMRVINRNHA